MMSNNEIVDWVKEHGKVVDSKLWKIDEPAEPEEDEATEAPPGSPGFNPARMFGRMRRMTQIYDLRPELGLKPSPSH
jgi:hypothetical protein